MLFSISHSFFHVEHTYQNNQADNVAPTFPRFQPAAHSLYSTTARASARADNLHGRLSKHLRARFLFGLHGRLHQYQCGLGKHLSSGAIRQCQHCDVCWRWLPKRASVGSVRLDLHGRFLLSAPESEPVDGGVFGQFLRRGPVYGQCHLLRTVFLLRVQLELCVYLVSWLFACYTIASTEKPILTSFLISFSNISSAARATTVETVPAATTPAFARMYS